MPEIDERERKLKVVGPLMYIVHPPVYILLCLGSARNRWCLSSSVFLRTPSSNNATTTQKKNKKNYYSNCRKRRTYALLFYFIYFIRMSSNPLRYSRTHRHSIRNYENLQEKTEKWSRLLLLLSSKYKYLKSSREKEWSGKTSRSFQEIEVEVKKITSDYEQLAFFYKLN